MIPIEPFNAPRGTVRAILTIMLVLVSASLLFVPSVEGSDDVSAMFVMLTALAVRDYFATRADQNEKDGPGVMPPAE